MLDGILSQVLSYRLFSHAGCNGLSTPITVGDAVTSASRRDGITPSRKLSYQGALGLLPLSALSAIPKYCYLFRLNESHEILVAKAEKSMR